jgi:NTE family protein
MQLRRRQYRVLFGIALAASYAFAQDALVPAAAQRPKIGLVPEGGGALGLAHVGVIQWLEEHRIPVSYVAGTFPNSCITVRIVMSALMSPAELHH